jgi:putative ABC transport system permease protein
VFEGAILRTLGADRRQLTILQFAEFATIGVLAGTIASAGSVALAMVLSDRVLGIAYDFSWGLPLVGIVVGALGVALAGLIGTRRAVNSPPLQTIRAVT